jgi:hypothetical protein
LKRSTKHPLKFTLPGFRARGFCQPSGYTSFKSRRRFPGWERYKLSDIFISYARSTAGQAEQIGEALRALGYGVWRDDELPAHRATVRPPGAG